MPDKTSPDKAVPDNDDDRRFAEIGSELASAVEAHLGEWVEREVRRLLEAYVEQSDRELTPDRMLEVFEQARDAGERARAEVGPLLHALLALDVDDQRTNPLSIVRSAVGYPTEVLRSAGVPEVVRDAQAVAHFPDDPYDLTPSSFAAIDQRLHEPGMMWGAAKAHVVLSRRRSEGRR